MAKYIDADKLIAKIKSRQKELVENIKNGDIHTRPIDGTKVVELQGILNIIDSLQQDQLSLPSNLDEAATQAANQMEIPTKHSQPESLTLIMRHIASKMFKAGAEWMARQMKQEQPAVDLEKEIDLFVSGWTIDKFLGLVNGEGWSVTVGDIKNVARHFYELGFNAKK